MDISIWGLLRSMPVSLPLLTTLKEPGGQDTDHRTCAEIQEFFKKCGRRLNIDLTLLQPLVALTLNFVGFP
jgi:hypothetical protein